MKSIMWLIKFLIGLFIILSSSIAIKACECSFDQQAENIGRKIEASRQVLDKNSLEDPEIVKRHLAIMFAVDQEVRKLFIDFDNPTTRKMLEEVDRFHTDYLKAILEIHGWVAISKFGKEADNQAWLLVQHADHDPDFQKHCVLQLQKLYPCGETDKKHYAYLYDRVALKSPDFGLKQRYGTQVQINDDQMELYPFEGSFEDLNNRRREMGMETVEEYMATLKEIYQK
jgi:hypothetical protein